MVYLEPITEETPSEAAVSTVASQLSSAAGTDDHPRASSSSHHLTSLLRPSSRAHSADEADGVPEGIRNNGLKRWWHVMGMSSHSTSARHPSSHPRHSADAADADSTLHSPPSISGDSVHSSGAESSGNSSTMALDMGDDGRAGRARGSGGLNLLPPLALEGGDPDDSAEVDDGFLLGGCLHPISSLDNEAGEANDVSVISLASLSEGSPTRSPRKGGISEGVDLSDIGIGSWDGKAVGFSQNIQAATINSGSPRRSPARGTMKHSPARGTMKHLRYAAGAHPAQGQGHGQGQGSGGELANANNALFEKKTDKKARNVCSRQMLVGFTLLVFLLAIVIGVIVHISSGESGVDSTNSNTVNSGGSNGPAGGKDDDEFATEAPTLEWDGDFPSLPMPAPTPAPTADPYLNEILAAADALLRSISPGAAAAIDGDETDTPQKLAYDWITNWDEANLELDVGQPRQSDYRNVVTERRYVQRFVLGVLYFSMRGKYTQRDPFYDFLLTLSESADVKPFLSAHHECQWFGISCESRFIAAQSDGNANGSSEEVVVSIDLSNLGLSGTIPDEIGRLEAMEDLSMFKNDIFGTIPESMMMLPVLAYVDLGSNSLTGSIPPISSHLEFLYLNQNRLAGSVPVPQGQNPKLKHLWAQQCQLAGPLPDRLAEYSNLEQLLLYENQITGIIPPELSSLSLLSHLDLSSNLLTGTLPDELYDMASLLSVYLSSNQLWGPIISESLPSSRLLTHLWLDGNSFSGEVSPSFGELINLRSLLIHQNNLEGTMPTEVCDLFGARGELERLEADCDGNVPVNCTCCTDCY